MTVESSENSQVLLHAILDSSKDVMVLAVDTDYRVIAFNKVWAQATLRNNQALPRKGMNVLDTLEDKNEVLKTQKKIDRACNGESINVIEEYGEKHYYDITYNPVRNKNGDVYAVTIFAKEVTEIIQIRQSLESALKKNKSLLQELQHRVKNNLNMILNIVDLEIDKHTSAEISGPLKNIRGRIRSIADLYESMNTLNPDDKIRLDNYINKIFQGIVKLYKTAEFNLTENIQLDETSVNIKTALPVGLILNEVLTNSFKHAFKERQSGSLEISLTSSRDSFTLDAADNGPGLPDEHKKNSDSMGMEIIQVLVQQLQGNLEIFGKDGCRFVLTVPIP